MQVVKVLERLVYTDLKCVLKAVFIENNINKQK